jgi:hypothetical protein
MAHTLVIENGAWLLDLISHSLHLADHDVMAPSGRLAALNCYTGRRHSIDPLLAGVKTEPKTHCAE